MLYINEFISTSSTNLWKAFFQILESFFELTAVFKFKIIVVLGLGMRGGEAFVLNSTRSSLKIFILIFEIKIVNKVEHLEPSCLYISQYF